MNVQEAVQIAMEYVRSFDVVFPTTGLRLEETEIDEHDNWLVTLSFVDADAFNARIFKQFVIDPKSRQVVAMKIRNPLAA